MHRSRRHGRTHALLVCMLAAGTLVRCDCEDVAEFVPAARYTPASVVDFGQVAVNRQKTMAIAVLSDGRAALIIKGFTLAGANEATQKKFQVTVEPDLMEGLTPGRTSSITITYTPCPAAWVEGVLDEDYPLGDCPGDLDQVQLKVTADRLEEKSFEIGAQPVQAPKLQIACPHASAACNADDPQLRKDCPNLSFGQVNAADDPCDLVLELRNLERNEKPTGPLHIEKMEVLVYNIDEGDYNDNTPEPEPPLYAGATKGFTFIDMMGNPINVDPAGPLTIEIPEGADKGAVRLKVRFNGQERGIWRGERDRGSGLRIYTDDPDNRPVAGVSLSGIGSAPNIDVLPRTIEFGPVEQGSTKTATVTVTNSGDSELRIASIAFETDQTGNLFTLSTSRDPVNFPIAVAENDEFEVFVHYTPRTSGQHSDVLKFDSNDPTPADNPKLVPLTGGAVPKLNVEPADALVFGLPNPTPPPPIPPRHETFLVRNSGYGDLTILSLDIRGPEGNPMHSSIDDFTIQGCAALPCTNPGPTLCPPSQPGCTQSQHTFTITYDNNDNSQTDLAELRIQSNDPTDLEHILVLSAQDIPCLYPAPVISVEPGDLVVGTEVFVNGRQSSPGGDPGGGTRIVKYRWRWLFTPGAKPAFTCTGGTIDPATGECETPEAVTGTSFTPLRHGAHVLGLDVTNSCGAESQSPATENITVAP